jgi:hypothetical protein
VDGCKEPREVLGVESNESFALDPVGYGRQAGLERDRVIPLVLPRCIPLGISEERHSFPPDILPYSECHLLHHSRQAILLELQRLLGRARAYTR